MVPAVPPASGSASMGVPAAGRQRASAAVFSVARQVSSSLVSLALGLGLDAGPAQHADAQTFRRATGRSGR
jgi:hypothetical protein